MSRLTVVEEGDDTFKASPELIATVEEILAGLKNGSVQGVALAWFDKDQGLRTLINTEKRLSQLSLGAAMLTGQITQSALSSSSNKN